MEIEEKNKVEKGWLYLVSTPIGNLSDLSPRGMKILSEVDFIAAEDTRVAAKLLSMLGLPVKSMVSYHDHNRHEKAFSILARLREGQSGALVTDAGTPAISDPGEDLVRECIDCGIPVTSVPGCCAAITALTLSGMDTRRFAFEGFLEGRTSDRIETLTRIAADIRTHIFYEAPHRLVDTLTMMAEVLGMDRRIALCRELTKRNEEILRTDLASALEHFKEQQPRGEYVLVVEGFTETLQTVFWSNMSVEEHVEYYTEKMSLSKMDAVKAVAKDRGVAKNIIYKQML